MTVNELGELDPCRPIRQEPSKNPKNHKFLELLTISNVQLTVAHWEKIYAFLPMQKAIDSLRVHTPQLAAYYFFRYPAACCGVIHWGQEATCRRFVEAVLNGSFCPPGTGLLELRVSAISTLGSTASEKKCLIFSAKMKIVKS